MTLGPVGQKMRAERDALRRRKEAKDRRQHGVDFTALEPCAHCEERHPPGYCNDPTEHELTCVAKRERCPRPCLAICVVRLTCPRCDAASGGPCSAFEGEQAGVIHQERYDAADRIALEQTPSIIRQPWGLEGLRAARLRLDHRRAQRERAPDG
jgi:hypothetical protein